jgi:hypothetical protein
MARTAASERGASKSKGPAGKLGLETAAPDLAVWVPEGFSSRGRTNGTIMVLAKQGWIMDLLG